LNNANEIIQKRAVTVSLLDKSLFNPRDVYADVITDRAAAVIFAHIIRPVICNKVMRTSTPKSDCLRREDPWHTSA